MKLIFKLHEVLNMIKGFTAGYTSSNKNSFIMDYENKRYKVTLEEIPEPNEEMYEDIEKYLQNNK